MIFDTGVGIATLNFENIIFGTNGIGISMRRPIIHLLVQNPTWSIYGDMCIYNEFSAIFCPLCDFGEGVLNIPGVALSWWNEELD